MHKTADNARGFTLIELAVVISVIAILAALLLNRVQFYQEQAEKAAMEQTVGILRSALHLQVSSLLAQGKTSDILGLANQNPMSWLAEKPKNYVGEYFAPKPQVIDSGNWYFDVQDKNLIYLVDNSAHFSAEKGERNQIRFQVRLVTAPENHDHATMGTVEGVILTEVVPYTWF